VSLHPNEILIRPIVSRRAQPESRPQVHVLTCTRTRTQDADPPRRWSNCSTST
jgi:hypothetical protein